MSRRVRVLVCGSNYGRSYVSALELRRDKFELAGILARGSPRSQQLAQRSGVPLYTRLAEVPADIDLVCDAMGYTGAPLVSGLLERGIPVLCEHPIKSADLQMLLDAAEAGGTRVHVNAHFAALDAPAAFVRCARDAGRAAPLRFVDAICTDRTLYAVVDLLGRMTTTLEAGEVCVLNRQAPFVTVRLALGDLRVTLQVQPSAVGEKPELEDGSPEYLVDFRLTAGFSSGLLSLLSIAGPVIWNANIYRSPHGALWTLCQEQEATWKDVEDQKTRANLASIECLFESTRAKASPADQKPEYLVQMAELWQQIGKVLS